MDLLASYHSDSDDMSEREDFTSGEYSETVKSKSVYDVDYFRLDCSSSDDDRDCYTDDKNVRDMAQILSDTPYNPERPASDHLNCGMNSKQNEANVDLHYVGCPIVPTYGTNTMGANSEDVKGSIYNTFVHKCAVKKSIPKVDSACDYSENVKGSIYKTFVCKRAAEKSISKIDADCDYSENVKGSIYNTFAHKCAAEKSIPKINSDCDYKIDTTHVNSENYESSFPIKKLKTICDGTDYVHHGNLNDDFYNARTKCSSMENLVDDKEKRASFSAYKQTKNYNEKSPSFGLPQRQIKTFNGHTGAISSLRWCVPMYGHLLLSGSFDSSLKVWNIRSKKMVQDVRILSSGIKAAQWMPCGTEVICGGFNKKVQIFDISSGKELMTYSVPSFVYSIEIHPTSQHLFVVGIKDKVLAFDTRSNLYEPIRKYESRCGQVLDIKFLEDGNEFVCSTDIVSGDSADRTIMAWDFSSGAQLSNQIFHERYTCPFLEVDPNNNSFVAQTNGNYIAVFSAQRPYKMNKNKRYDGHKVLGYPIGCDFSTNGKYLASGDAEGGFYIFWNNTAHLIKRLDVKPSVPTTQVKWHPYLHTTVATSSWDGEIQLWQ